MSGPKIITNRSYRIHLNVFIFGFVYLLLLSIPSYSQDLRFTRLSQEDGLSNGRHWAKRTIIKDNFGIVWISTVDGFNRWDGYENEIFKNDPFDTTSIHSNFVTSISQAPDGDIYMGTAAKGVARYDYETDVFVDIGLGQLIEGNIAVHNLICDAVGNVWMGVGRSGILKYIIEKDSFEFVSLFKNNSKFSEHESINNALVLKDSTLIFSTIFGLHVYNEEQDTFEFISTYPNYFEYLAEGEDGEIWGSNRLSKDILILDRKNGILDTLAVPGQDIHNVSAIRKDPEGNMWFGKGHEPLERITKYDVKSGEFSFFHHDPNDPRSFSLSVANAMVIDSLGQLWYMSTSKGAGYTRIEDTYFEKVLDYPVNNIHFKNDSILILPSESNIQSFNLNTSEVKVIYPKEKNIAFRPSLLDSEGNLWFFWMVGKGLFKLNLESNEIKNIPAIYAGALAEQKDVIWSANAFDYIEKNSMIYHDMNEIIEAKGLAPIPTSHNYSICVLKDGNVLRASASDGLYLLNSKDTSYTHYDGLNFEVGKLSSSAVLKIRESEFSNTVYLTTNENINIWNRDTDTFSYVNRADGLKGRPLSMIEDEDGHLWVLTSMGIHKIINGKVIARYGKEYGLIGMVDRIDPNMERDKDGFIYFSTSNAFYRFHPDRLDEMRPPQDILIQHLYLNRELQKPTTSAIISKNILYKPNLNLSFENRDIGFGYVSPFGKDRNIEYYYRLVGYDDQWFSNGTQRQIHFTSLKSGQYRLQLKGKSIEGLWTEISEYPFYIKPPWYGTWWAYLLYGIIICSIFYGIYRYRINQLLRYQNLRTKISSDLHDDVGTLLSSLAWQTDVIGMSVDEKAQEKFSKISTLSRTAMERMRDTVWAIDSRRDDVMSLMDRMKDFLIDNFEDRELKFKFEHDSFDEKNKIAPDIRQNMYLIFKEAVTNAVKHSNGNLVSVELRQSKGTLILNVHDNGVVDQTSIKSSGLGLSNMKMRAERINAEINQTWDSGCRIGLRVPL